MTVQTIRLGVVGYGWNHPNYKHPERAGVGGRGAGLFRQSVDCFEDIQPAAVCDTAPEALALARENFPDIATFDDFDTMLQTASLDALIIGTPALNHAGFAIKALEHDVHVLSEIPVVYSVEEADRLWQAHLHSKALYMTGANPNFKGHIDAAVDLKRRGLLGDPVYVEAEYLHSSAGGRGGLRDRTPWRRETIPIQYCTHSLGPMLRLIEEEFEWVTCFDTGSHLNPDIQPPQHDFMAALLRTRSNVVMRLLISFVNHAGHQSRQYRIFTTKGVYERPCAQFTTMGFLPTEGARTLFYSKDLPLSRNRIELPVGDMPPALEKNPKATGHGGIDYAMLDAFYRAIRERGPSPVSLREGLCMTLPGIYAAESARNGGAPTRIRYPWDRDNTWIT